MRRLLGNVLFAAGCIYTVLILAAVPVYLATVELRSTSDRVAVIVAMVAVAGLVSGAGWYFRRELHQPMEGEYDKSPDAETAVELSDEDPERAAPADRKHRHRHGGSAMKRVS